MRLIKLAFSFFAVAAMVSMSTAVPAQPSSSTSEQMSSGDSAGQPSDLTLKKEVESALAGDPLTNTSSIQVKMEDRMVILSGTAASKQAAKRADQIASRVNGVKGIEDYINYPH